VGALRRRGSGAPKATGGAEWALQGRGGARQGHYGGTAGAQPGHGEGNGSRVLQYQMFAFAARRGGYLRIECWHSVTIIRLLFPLMTGSESGSHGGSFAENRVKLPFPRHPANYYSRCFNFTLAAYLTNIF